MLSMEPTLKKKVSHLIFIASCEADTVIPHATDEGTETRMLSSLLLVTPPLRNSRVHSPQENLVETEGQAEAWGAEMTIVECWVVRVLPL